jgi:hypothetical protein
MNAVASYSCWPLQFAHIVSVLMLGSLAIPKALGAVFGFVRRRLTRAALAILLFGTIQTVTSQPVVAQTVWSGFTKTFTKPAGSDYTLPQYQDALTASVIFTRANFGGLFNVAAESSFTSSFSPKLTEWATDINNLTETIAATNWQNLAFTNWVDAFGGPVQVGHTIAERFAVVHLLPDNVYLDLRFTMWGNGPEGAGFSYTRAEPPAVPEPCGLLLAAIGGISSFVFRHHR